MNEAPRRSLRGRLTLAVAVLLVGAFGVTFVAVYRGTGSQLQAQIDHELRVDATGFARQVAPPAVAPVPATLAAAARRYLSVQPFRVTSRLLIDQVPGQPPATNEPELLGLSRPDGDEPPPAQGEEDALTRGLLSADPGYSTVEAPDVGRLRLLVVPVLWEGRTIGRISVGEPLETVRRAQEGVRHTFLLAGGLTLAAALLASYLLASGFSAPLRRMAAIARRVDEGDLSPRIGGRGRRDEVRVLADAFDHMLDRLEDAFDRQRAFVADASHELRTPLAGIRGQLEVLARQGSPTPEEVRRVERLVTGETERMARIVDDLLTLAQSDEPHYLAHEPIDLRPFVADLFELTSATARRRFELGDVPAGTLEADRTRLAQAVGNLLENAIGHTKEGGRVRLSVERGDGDRVSFAVEDDGPGIPAEQRERIFDRFHRTDVSRARSSGGTGLGLAIVRAIVVAHGGEVRAGSAAGGGARVEFELPGFRVQAPEGQPETGSVPAP
jgi:signal transduction histidine kinase